MSKTRKRLLILGVITAGVLTAGIIFRPEHPYVFKNRIFHKTIATADQIVFFDPNRIETDFKVVLKNHDQLVNGIYTKLLDSKDPKLIQEFNALLQLELPNRSLFGFCEVWHCSCSGCPHVYWYRNGEKIAQVSIHHCESLCWPDSDGNINLTPESQKALKTFLLKHNLPVDISGGSEEQDEADTPVEESLMDSSGTTTE